MTSQFFPFVIPWDDAAPGTATDVSWLNEAPAGAGGHIVSRDGHFHESKTGKQVRFLATNFTFAADFPTHGDAQKVAAHLAKLGINMVRIHHHDWATGQLWDKRFGDHLHFDPEMVDRLDYLIYQLKTNGIYMDLNLHVSRKFSAADGFPASVEQIGMDFDKRVDYFDPKMIELQKKFAKDYLAHVNPYTKLPYTEDPCVAIVEITNEDSLVDNAAHWGAGGLDDLPEPFRAELSRRWNAWLKAKYGDDKTLAEAWMAGVAAPGASLITSQSAWAFDQIDQTNVTLVDEAADAGAIDAGPAAHFRIAAVDAARPPIQACFGELDLTDYETYTVTFRARADAPRSMRVLIENDPTPLHGADYPLTNTIGRAALTAEWRKFTYTFSADRVHPGHGRISFTLGNQVGEAWIRDVRLQPGAELANILPSGCLAAGNVPMPSATTTPEVNDWVACLADIELTYADEMRDYVVSVLGSKANVCCTQISWGASEGMYREQNMEFADNHAYWEHPRFTVGSWGSASWLIGNTPMTANLVTGGGGTLRSLAEYRIAGKPYTITEYNQPAPNDYRCEWVPELAAFAAAQDWDGIFLFEWGQYGEGAPNEQIQDGFFAICSDPAPTAFIPSAAMIFRCGQMPICDRSSTLHLPVADSLKGIPIGNYWTAGGVSKSDYLGTRLEVQLDTSETKARIVPNTVGSGRTAGFVQHGSDPASAYFTAGASAAFGYLAGKQIELGRSKLAVEPFGNGFCTVTIADVAHAGSAGRILVTIVGKVENTGMKWNPDRTSVGHDWGEGPTVAEYVPAELGIAAPAGSKVYALDGTGKRTKEIASTYVDGRVSFHTDPTAETVWYEVGA